MRLISNTQCMRLGEWNTDSRWKRTLPLDNHVVCVLTTLLLWCRECMARYRNKKARRGAVYRNPTL